MSHKLIQEALSKLLKPKLSEALTSSLKTPEMLRYRERINDLFEYTMSDGKYARSRLALDTYKALNPTSSNQDLVSAAKVAASIELMQTFYLIIDDIMDDAKMRRGKPCWHTKKGIGLTAINDGLLLDCAIDWVIREAIPQHPQKAAILQTLYETKRKTVIGQMIDSDAVDLDQYNWDRYNQIIEHKTSHYTYYCPLAVGCYLADNITHLSEIQKFAYKIGSLFQAQDDYLDVFGDEKVTGKSSTDLADRKCSWVVCQTLEKIKSKPDILKEFKENFGQSNEIKIQKTKQIIREAGVEEDFKKFEKNLAQNLYMNADNFIIQDLRTVLKIAINDLCDRKK